METEIVKFKNDTYDIRRVISVETFPCGQNTCAVNYEYEYLQLIGRDKDIVWTDNCYDSDNLSLLQCKELMEKILDIGTPIESDQEKDTPTYVQKTT